MSDFLCPEYLLPSIGSGEISVFSSLILTFWRCHKVIKTVSPGRIVPAKGAIQGVLLCRKSNKNRYQIVKFRF